jgi:hypothetical protein
MITSLPPGARSAQNEFTIIPTLYNGNAPPAIWRGDAAPGLCRQFVSILAPLALTTYQLAPNALDPCPFATPVLASPTK